MVGAPVLHGEEGGGEIGRHLGERHAVTDLGPTHAIEVPFLVEEGVRGGTVERIEVGTHGKRRRGRRERECDSDPTGEEEAGDGSYRCGKQDDAALRPKFGQRLVPSS
jgi:hypothetical protein